MKKRKYLLNYTFCFLILSLAMLLPLLLAGKSLVWIGDGDAQYFPYLHYVGNYLRDFAENLFQGDFSVKMYDFTLGMGDDVNAVFRSHPLDFLSVLVPGRYTEVLYNLLTLLRMYLAGLGFSAFCLYMKRPASVALLGSMVYLSCGYVMKLGMMHPTFLSAMIVLPLLLLGAEQVMKKGSILLFSFVTAMGFLSNYYFMYMCTLALGVYVLVRFFELYQDRRGREFFSLAFRMGGAYLLGLGMTAAVLFPTIMRLTSSLRLETESAGENLLFYENWKRYYQWFLDLIVPYRNTGSNTHLNFCVLALPAAVLLFLQKGRKYLGLKAALVLEVVMLLIPAGGYVMAGFSNVNNRWTFLLSFTLALACVLVFQEFHVLTKKAKRALLILCLAFGGAAAYDYLFQAKNPYVLLGFGELLAAASLLAFGTNLWRGKKERMRALFGLVMVSTLINSYATFSPSLGNMSSQFTDRGQVLSDYETSPYTRYSRIEEDGFFRTDTSVMGTGKENCSVILGYQGVSMYNSVLNGDLTQYLLDQESPGINAVHRIFGLDGRTASEALANVTYYMTAAGDEQQVPYGFALDQQASTAEYFIYKNQHPLAFGYTYDTVISREDYEKLSPLERQQVMLEAAVVERGEAGKPEKTGETEDAAQTEKEKVSGFPKSISSPSQEILTIPVELPQKGDGIKATENGYRAVENLAELSFPFEKKAGYECYVRLVGLERNRDYSFVDVYTDELAKTLTVRGKTAVYSLGRSNYLVNLGHYDQEGQGTIRLSFREKGNYKLAGVELCYVPLGQYEAQIEQLNQEVLEDVEFGPNRISGRVSLEDKKIMAFSIPYSRGWKATVDGKPATLEKVNVAYLGLSLEPGEHEVLLTYRSPGSRAGTLVTVISVTVFVLLLVLWIRKRRFWSKS